MPRKLYSPNRRKQLILSARAELDRLWQKRALYNTEYVMSPFFKSSLKIRACVLCFIAYLLLLNTCILFPSREIIKDVMIGELNVNGYTGSKANKNLTIRTTYNNTYAVDFLESKPDMFSPNDTISIFRNAFYKKTYVAQSRSAHLNQVVKYTRCDNFLKFTLTITIFSLFLRDGYDLLSRVFMRVVLCIDIGSILLYLIL